MVWRTIDELMNGECWEGRALRRLIKKLSTRHNGPEVVLMTGKLRKDLPPLDEQRRTSGDAIAHARFFMLDDYWSWYPTEFDGDDTFFGLAGPLKTELAYFSLDDLEAERGPLGFRVQRDLRWVPKPLREVAPSLFRG